MSGDGKFFLGVIIAAILAIGGFVLFSNGDGATNSSQKIDIDASIGYKRGPDNALVKIIEFGDFQCQACAGAAENFEKIQENNPEKVQIIYRHFPLTEIHRNAYSSAQAAEAAGAQGKFWEMYNLLFINQSTWSDLGDATEFYVEAAKTLGLDENKFRNELNNDDFKKKINFDSDFGDKVGVNSTPTFFINGKQFTGGRSIEDWQKAVDQALAEIQPE